MLLISHRGTSCRPTDDRRPGTRVPGSGSQVERAGEATEKGTPTAQHFDHSGCDRTIRAEIARDDPAYPRTGGKGEVDDPVPARHVQDGAVHPDQELGGTEPRGVGGRR